MKEELQKNKQFLMQHTKLLTQLLMEELVRMLQWMQQEVQFMKQIKVTQMIICIEVVVL